MKPAGDPHPWAGSAASRDGRRSAVFLVGFMGAGKTSVGRILSQKLGWAFEDLDERIEAQQGRSIEAIFQNSGEGKFRNIETAALRSLLEELRTEPRIVALGGGTFVQPENVRLLEEASARVVFLDGSADELFRRCAGERKERPLRRDAGQFRALYHQRRPGYLKATWRVDTGGKDPEAVATEVVCSLGLL